MLWFRLRTRAFTEFIKDVRAAFYENVYIYNVFGRNVLYLVHYSNKLKIKLIPSNVRFCDHQTPTVQSVNAIPQFLELSVLFPYYCLTFY